MHANQPKSNPKSSHNTCFAQNEPKGLNFVLDTRPDTTAYKDAQRGGPAAVLGKALGNWVSTEAQGLENVKRY